MILEAWKKQYLTLTEVEMLRLPWQVGKTQERGHAEKDGLCLRCGRPIQRTNHLPQM